MLASGDQYLAFARYDSKLALVCVLSRAETNTTVSISNSMLCLSELVESMGGDVGIGSEHMQVDLGPFESMLFVAKR